jgi:mannose/cellobiose epimerase-like protein (N-acyl-D-glucosamine 2-epimerase family)
MDRSNSGAQQGPWPQVKWMKVAVLTATVKSSAPQEVEQSYHEWQAWVQFIQEVRFPPV